MLLAEPPLASFSQIGFTWEKRTRQPWKEKKKEQKFLSETYLEPEHKNGSNMVQNFIFFGQEH